MAKRLPFAKAHRLSKLHDELLAAGITPERVEGTVDGKTCWITVDDAFDPAVVQAVVDAHDPTPVPAPDPDAELAAAIQAATTLEQLKAALLGNSGRAAKAKGRLT